MRNRYRESTAAILGSLSKGSATCESCAQACRLKTSNTATLLLRLFRMGHVKRERIEEGFIVIDADSQISRPRYVYMYSITPKGTSRLKYIQSVSNE